MREVFAHSLVQDVGFASTEKPRDDDPGKLYANLRVDKVFLIPAFSIQGSDSEPGVLLAKQRPKVPAALHEPLAEPPLEPDR